MNKINYNEMIEMTTHRNSKNGYTTAHPTGIYQKGNKFCPICVLSLELPKQED